MSAEREAALFGLWRRVNEIADTTEDSNEIRSLIAEAGIAPGVHVRDGAAQAMPPAMVAEWMLGQWADMIDADAPFLNTLRNVSHFQYEQVVGG